MSDVFIAEQDGTGFYPCAADTFDARYEPAAADEATATHPEPMEAQW